MRNPQLIGPRTLSTSAETEDGPHHPRELPDDLLRDASRRLSIGSMFWRNPMGRGMALHHRISPLDFLEGCPRVSVVIVLSWCDIELAAALINLLQK